MREHLYWGVVIFGHFVLDSAFGTHVVRHGHFTLKQLRLPVLNEMHTNSCTGPRLFNVHGCQYPVIYPILLRNCKLWSVIKKYLRGDICKNQ